VKEEGRGEGKEGPRMFMTDPRPEKKREGKKKKKTGGDVWYRHSLSPAYKNSRRGGRRR